MLNQIIASDLLEDLSAEEQELLSGGQREIDLEVEEEEEEGKEFPTGARVRRIPIRLTGILEVVKPKKDKED
jgi:hypothetical protein